MVSHWAAISRSRSNSLARVSRRALTSSASVRGIRPTLRRVNNVVDSTSAGASYQMMYTDSDRYL